jgi:hypothetical protein
MSTTGSRPGRRVGWVAALFALVGGGGLATAVAALLSGEIVIPASLALLLVARDLLRRRAWAHAAAVVLLLGGIAGLLASATGSPPWPDGFAIAWGDRSLDPEAHPGVYIATSVALLIVLAGGVLVLLGRDVRALFWEPPGRSASVSRR